MTLWPKNYRQLEMRVTLALGCDLLFFILFLIAGGTGVIWLKVLSAIFIFLLSIVCLGYLFLTRELLRQRSLWMSILAVAIVICTLISLLVNFPCPAPSL